MEEFDRAIFYIAILSGLLILVAYHAGANQLLGTSGQQLNSLVLTVTGRNAQGQFGSYPH